MGRGLNYDKDNKNSSGIQTDYMYDLMDINFPQSVFLMNFTGLPAQTSPGGMFFVTTEPASIF